MSATSRPVFWFRNEPLQIQHYEGQLSAEQGGAHRYLAEAYFLNPASLINDPPTLARIARVEFKRWPKVWNAIGHLFKQEGQHIVSLVGKEWRSETLASQQKRRDSGRKGGITSAGRRHLQGVGAPGSSEADEA